MDGTGIRIGDIEISYQANPNNTDGYQKTADKDSYQNDNPAAIIG
jgi:hypothetical protein